MSLFQALAALRTATEQARARTGESGLSTEAAGGRVRVVVMVKEGRKVAAIPAGPSGSVEQAITLLNSLQSHDDVTTAMARRVH